jgi:hypothetical protein
MFDLCGNQISGDPLRLLDGVKIPGHRRDNNLTHWLIFHTALDGSRSPNTLTLSPPTAIESPATSTVFGKRPCTVSYLSM